MHIITWRAQGHPYFLKKNNNKSRNFIIIIVCREDKLTVMSHDYPSLGSSLLDYAISISHSLSSLAFYSSFAIFPTVFKVSFLQDTSKNISTVLISLITLVSWCSSFIFLLDPLMFFFNYYFTFSSETGFSYLYQQA